MTQRPAQVTDEVTLAQLAAQVAALSARVEELESQLDVVREFRREQGEHISDEVLLAISAAVAAYLGKRARVRQVRLRRGSIWASQGRAAIQQSHAFPLVPAMTTSVRKKN